MNDNLLTGLDVMISGSPQDARKTDVREIDGETDELGMDRGYKSGKEGGRERGRERERERNGR